MSHVNGVDSNTPEHPDLVENMVPVAGCLELFGKDIVELLPHVNDAVGHCLYVAFPFFEQPGIVED
jgi:hypothetical protein